MRHIFLLLIMALVALPCFTVSAQVVRLADEVELPIADGWELLGDSSSYPFLVMSTSKESELLIFKSTLGQDGSIDNQASLKASVDRVIDSVILTLPESKLLTSSGYNDGDNVRFVLEFTSQDMAEGGMVRHRMMGVLYRLSNGEQDLFTLWGRAGFDDYPQFAEDLAGMQQDFRLVGAHSANVFQTSRNRLVTFGVPILLVIGLVVLTRYRQRLKAKVATPRIDHWKCACGTENRENERSCAFCGQSRQVSRVS